MALLCGWIWEGLAGFSVWPRVALCVSVLFRKGVGQYLRVILGLRVIAVLDVSSPRGGGSVSLCICICLCVFVIFLCGRRGPGGLAQVCVPWEKGL